MADAARKLETTAEIDLMDDGIYIVKDGQLTKMPKPMTDHGSTIISWQNGKPCHGKMEHSFKF